MKRSRTAVLLLMSASPLLLSACTGDEETAREGLYTSVETCAQQTGDQATCQQAFDKAKAETDQDSPRFASREECAQGYDWDRCEERKDSNGHSFFGPMMAGFFMSQMMRNGAPMTGFQGSPAYQTRAGGWQRPDRGPTTGGVYSGGAGGSPKLLAVDSTPNRAVTVSRGGFGSSFSSRSAGG